MAPRPRLVLSEEAVRERSGLGPHGDLAELRSLSIPGTYQEKITHLGSSLMRLTGLKSLDLSRNSLVSLEGVQCLVSLESLNLYYNSIASLAEVFRLRPLARLRDVDLRLNPVVKSESDYRLFVVHLLPELRQLDDRPVRESERKASRLHFASEDSLDSKESFSAAVTAGRPHPSRARCADPSARKCLAMDADDEAVLNLIAECEWDLSNPPGSRRAGQEYEAEDLHRAQGESRRLLSPPSIQHQCGDSVSRGQEKRKGSGRGCRPEQLCGGPPPRSEPAAGRAHGPHRLFTPHPESTEMEDSASSLTSDLSSQQAVNPLPVPEKYRKRRMPGGSFQVPSDLSCLERAGGPCSLEESSSRQEGCEGRSQGAASGSEALDAEEQTSPSTSGTSAPAPGPQSAAPPGPKAALDGVLLPALLDLVDRHWSGCRSLHGNEAFLAQARHVLSSAQEMAAARDSSGHLALENASLRSRLTEQQERHAAALGGMTRELGSARRETDTLKQQLDKSLEENSSLKSLLFNMKKEVKNADASATLNLQLTGLQTSVQRLSCELVELKQHLEHYDKIQELTHMLQESHSALVSTNEHLLQELGRARALHRAEVQQMRWSFQEFRKTAALFPPRPRSASLGGRQSC